MNHRLRLTLSWVVAIVFLLVIALPAAARAPIALGISKGNNQDTIAAFDYFTDQVNGGVAPALWTLRSKWGGPDKAFPTAGVNALAARGATAVIWWSPMDPTWKKQHRYADLGKILKGKHDDYIDQWALDAEAAGHDVIVRLMHEGNVDVFPWGKGWFQNTPKKFRKAWRRVVKRVRARTDNVQFLWSVAKQTCKGCNPYKAWYPGDAWVDWVGFSGFNWGGYRGRKWVGMVKSFTQPMRKIRKFAASKPVIAVETASHFKNGNKAKWLKKGYNGVYRKWNKLKAIMYLDSNEPHKDFNHPDWRLKKPNNGSAAAQYRKLSAKPEFGGSLP